MAKLDPNQTEQLKAALAQHDLEAVRALVEQGMPLDGKTPQGGKPLQLALEAQSWLIAEYLLEQGASPRNLAIQKYYAPLSWACIYRQPRLVKALLRAGVHVDETDQMNRTALNWAAETNQPEILRLLLAQGADPNHSGKYVYAPLLSVCRVGNLEMARLLLDHGAQSDPRDYFRHTPLHMAAFSSEPELITLLLERNAAVDPLTDSLQTPLHLAAESGKTEIVKRLLAAGANPGRRSKEGQTPLMLSTRSASVETFNQLLPVTPSFSEADRSIGLEQALRRQDPGMIKRMLAWFDLSAPLNQDHALIIAIRTELWDAVQTLLQSGIDPEVKHNSEPLLLWSIENRKPQLTRMLLAHGAQAGREQAIFWIDNLILLRKYGKLLLAPGTATQPLDDKYLIALQKNIESLGFVLSEELAERVLSLSLAELEAFYDWLIPSLRVMVGAKNPFTPMYPGFPAQVKEMPERELYLNAMRHYWGDLIGRRIMPKLSANPRPALDEKTRLKPLGLAAPEDLEQLFTRLLQARSALRKEDKEDLTWFVDSRQDAIVPWLPADVPMRENAALLAAALLRHPGLRDRAGAYVKQPLDLLRIATALAEGDVSLAENTRFCSFSKPLRRWLLAQLEALAPIDEALWRQPEKFKRLGEKLHPGEYKARYPQVWEAFARLRAGVKSLSFGRQLELALAAGDIATSLGLLRQRPGLLARRLDQLLRLSSPAEQEAVVTAFAASVGQIPTPLTLQLLQHFQTRPEPKPLRVFFPKGELAKLRAIDNRLPALDPELCARIAELCRQALLEHYATRYPLGRCWLDPRLQHYSVPFALRSAAKALRTVGRGSRINFGPDAGPLEAVRFFIWWRDGKDRTDLDLSALVLDADFGYITTLAYYNLKDFGGCHSGDITSAPQGAAEFIDIELATSLARGARYVLMVVNSYTTQSYCDLPECFAGFMLRQKPNSGEIFEARTVQNKFDLTANSTIAIPLILDLYTREVIWTDLSLKRNPSHVNNVHGNRSSLSLLAQAMVNLNRPSLHSLFELQIDARGERVYNRDQAETVFGLEEGITPYDIPRILSEFL